MAKSSSSEPQRNKEDFIKLISTMSQQELDQLIKQKGKKPKRMCGFIVTDGPSSNNL